MGVIRKQRDQAHLAVVQRLKERGFTASIADAGTRRMCVVASPKFATRDLRLIIKTKQHKTRMWTPRAHDEKRTSSACFYVFVSLGIEANDMTFHIVHSSIVAERIAKTHVQWCSKTRRDKTPRADTPMRKFTDDDGEFLDKWESLLTTWR